MELLLHRCGVVWCGVVWCGVVWCGVVWCGVVWCGVVWCGVVWCGVVWCGVVWCGVVWCGVVCMIAELDGQYPPQPSCDVPPFSAAKMLPGPTIFTATEGMPRVESVTVDSMPRVDSTTSYGSCSSSIFMPDGSALHDSLYGSQTISEGQPVRFVIVCVPAGAPIHKSHQWGLGTWERPVPKLGIPVLN